MARITTRERDFWLGFFRKKINDVRCKYEADNYKLLQQELPAQAKVKAYDSLGITTLIDTYDKLDQQIKERRSIHEAAKKELTKRFDEAIEPLKSQLEMAYAKRMAKTIDGSVSGWKKYNLNNRHTYGYEQVIRQAEQVEHEKLYQASDVGKHLDKIKKQYEDVPVALMLATSRLEMANAVRQLAVVIGVDLPVTTSLEDLT